MSDELIQERDKVVNLMSDLNKSKGDVASLAKYRSVQFFTRNMKVLIAENDQLKRQYKHLLHNVIVPL
jgi:hypothetical protein